MAGMSFTYEAPDGSTITVGGEGDTYTIRKISAIVPVSEGMAMDYGLIPDTREPVKVSRRQRLRWRRWQEKRYAARMRLASWIAGFDVTERD